MRAADGENGVRPSSTHRTTTPRFHDCAALSTVVLLLFDHTEIIRVSTRHDCANLGASHVRNKALQRATTFGALAEGRAEFRGNLEL